MCGGQQQDVDATQGLIQGNLDQRLLKGHVFVEVVWKAVRVATG